MQGAMMLAGAIGLLHVVLGLAGAAIAALYVGRSRWAPLLAAGFGAEAVLALATRLGPMLLAGRGDAMTALGSFYALTTFLGVLAQGAVVAGVAGLLKDAVAPNPSSAP